MPDWCNTILQCFFAINNSFLYRELNHSYLWPNFTESKIRLQNVQLLNIMFGEWLTNKFWHLLEQTVCYFSHFWTWFKAKFFLEINFWKWIPHAKSCLFGTQIHFLRGPCMIFQISRYFIKKSMYIFVKVGSDKTKHCLISIASKQQIINNLEQDTSNNEMTLTIAKQRMNNNPPPPSVNYNVYKVLWSQSLENIRVCAIGCLTQQYWCTLQTRFQF